MQPLSTPSPEGQSSPITKEVVDYELARMRDFLRDIPPEVRESHPNEHVIKIVRGWFRRLP
jgi:hypothetical protein